MTPAEAAALLAVAAAFDNRKPDAAAAKAWSVALDGYRFEDCRDAVVAHYRSSSEWIMPAHVVAGVKRIRASRISAVALTPPRDLDPDDTAAYQRWLATERSLVADGHEPSAPQVVGRRNVAELGQAGQVIPDA